MKRPERTLRWARLCDFVSKEFEASRTAVERADLMEFCLHERAKAEAEGYEDSAEYIGHVIDDLEKL